MAAAARPFKMGALRVQYAIALPNFGAAFREPRVIVELAQEAEAAGWNGFFLWDHIGSDWLELVVDPWCMLAAIAVSTERLIVGTTITPVPRRRPWKFARETATLDHLSLGRLRVGVGIGTDSGREYSCFGEASDDRVHASMLDEALTVVTKLWTGKQFSFEGQHYTLTNAQFLPSAFQQPRIPIWVAGMWPNKLPFQRAARWDGVCPISKFGPLSPFEVAEIVTYINRFRSSDEPFDVVCAGTTTGKRRDLDQKRVQAYINAGATWWVESLANPSDGVEQHRERIGLGPPRLE